MQNQFSSFQESLEYEWNCRNKFILTKEIVKINLRVDEMYLEVTLKIFRFRIEDDDPCRIDLYEEEDCRAAQVNNSTNN